MYVVCTLSGCFYICLKIFFKRKMLDIDKFELFGLFIALVSIGI